MNLSNIHISKVYMDCIIHSFTLLDILTDFRNCLKIYYINSLLFTLMFFSIISPYLVYWSSHYHFEHIIENISLIISNNQNTKSILSYLINQFFFGILILLSTPIVGIFCTMFEIIFYYILMFLKPILIFSNKIYDLSDNKFINNINNICKIDSEDANRYFIILELFYESIPQIILQTYIFYNLDYYVSDNNKYGLTESDLYTSIVCAVGNVLLNLVSLCRSADRFGLSVFTYFPYFMGSKIKKVYAEAVPVKDWLVSRNKNCILGRVKDFYISDMFPETLRLLNKYSKEIKDESINKKMIIPMVVKETDLYKLNESEFKLDNICLFGQILRKLCKKNKIFIDFSIDSIKIHNFKNELIHFTSYPSEFWIESYNFYSSKKIINNKYIKIIKNFILGRHEEFRNETIINLDNFNNINVDTFSNLINFIIPMFDIYNCFYKPSNLISYIICISLFSHDKDLEKLIQLIYDIRHNKIDYLLDDDLRIFLFNDNTISEVFKFLSIVFKNNITDMSIRNLSNLPVEIDYSDQKEKEMVTNFILLLIDLNIKHIPDNIQLSLSKMKTKTLTKNKPIFVGSIDLYMRNNYQNIFTIHCEYINCLYFKLYILIDNEPNYLNIGKNSNNIPYLHTNNKSENMWYFIKKNNSIRTSNFNKTKVIPIDFEQNQDSYLIISKDSKYILKIKKPEDIFNTYEDWNKFKTSKNFLVSNMIVTLINNKEYILDIVSRDDIISNDTSNYLYLSNHEDSINDDDCEV